MAFMLFKKERDGKGIRYADLQQGYKLAGSDGLLCRLWRKQNKPTGKGWSATAQDLLREHNPDFGSDSHALVIDFDPKARRRIGLVEVEAVHVYTYGAGEAVWWSPMMLELRDLYYKEDFPVDLTEQGKRDILKCVPPPADRKKKIEFLYLQGNWLWGRNGSTNAAFIDDAARKYFLPYFQRL